MPARSGASPRRPMGSPAREPAPSEPQHPVQLTQEEIITQIKKISRSESDRLQAIQTLVSNQSQIQNLAVMLWFSPATATSMLSEVLEFYPSLVSVKLTTRKADLVFSILTLFQLIAGCEDTRIPFIKANFPVYLYPILQYTVSNVEHERYAQVVISIIANLVKDSSCLEAIDYLVKTEFLPLCIRVISLAKGQLRIGSLFILGRILATDDGKKYVHNGSGQDRAKAVLTVMNQLVVELARVFDKELSKYVVVVYDELLSVAEIQQIAKGLFDEITLPVSTAGDAQYKDLVNKLKNTRGKR